MTPDRFDAAMQKFLGIALRIRACVERLRSLAVEQARVEARFVGVSVEEGKS